MLYSSAGALYLLPANKINETMPNITNESWFIKNDAIGIDDATPP